MVHPQLELEVEQVSSPSLTLRVDLVPAIRGAPPAALRHWQTFKLNSGPQYFRSCLQVGVCDGGPCLLLSGSCFGCPYHQRPSLGIPVDSSMCPSKAVWALRRRCQKQRLGIASLALAGTCRVTMLTRPSPTRSPLPVVLPVVLVVVQHPSLARTWTACCNGCHLPCHSGGHPSWTAIPTLGSTPVGCLRSLPLCVPCQTA